MRQLALDLGFLVEASLDNFVPGRNTEVLALLRSIAAGATAPRLIYLWGDSGCGRSHLLRALAAPARHYIAAAELSAGTSAAVVLLDDVEFLSAEAQQTLFRWLVDAPPQLIVSGARAPLFLQLRDDLRSRLAAGLVFQVHALNDAEKRAALLERAQAMGLGLPAPAIDYLLAHGPRDMRSLMSTLVWLDRMSLEQQRRITPRLLREFLQRPREAGLASDAF
jgi:DnaA family protein